jgi:hypothetical protein
MAEFDNDGNLIGAVWVVYVNGRERTRYAGKGDAVYGFASAVKKAAGPGGQVALYRGIADARGLFHSVEVISVAY